MFGEKNIVGSSEIIIKSNNKMKLPKYTLAETGDNLALYYFENIDSYWLFNIKDIQRLCDIYKQKIKETTDIEERLKLRNHELSILRAIKGPLLKVDKNKQITFNSEEVGTAFKCKGYNKHIMLERLK